MGAGGAQYDRAIQRSIHALALVLATCTALAVAGCGGGDGDAPGTRDRGDLRVAFDPPENEAERRIRQVLEARRGAGVERLARGLNEAVALPRDVTIKIDHGDPSPYFDPERREIHLQYEFVRSLNGAARLVDFVLVHEIGHALVDAYELPVRGTEEDAVDALATVMMSRFVDGGSDVALAGAGFFGTPGGRQRTGSGFWDEHSLDRRRAYAIVCWVAGSSRTHFRAVADARPIGGERLRSCPAEYRRNVTRWLPVLKPHLKS